MEKVVIHPDRHFANDENPPLVDELQQLGFDVETVPYVHQDTGRRLGVNWYEVIRVYLTDHAQVLEAVFLTEVLNLAGDAAKDSAKEAMRAVARRIGEAFVGWARKRSRIPGRNPKQPKQVIIYGPDNKTVILTVTVTDPGERARHPGVMSGICSGAPR